MEVDWKVDRELDIWDGTGTRAGDRERQGVYDNPPFVLDWIGLD